MDNKAFFKIGYGLYVLTAKDAERDNGCIINTLMQVTSAPSPVGVIAVNKANFTHDMITSSGQFNISALSVEAPFDLFKHFGFQTGKDTEKILGYSGVKRSGNGLVYLSENTNAYLSFKVSSAADFGKHTMFTADITDAKVLSDAESLTYAYYHKHIKPRPAAAQSKGYRCVICGYVYEGEPLPADFICPLCKHGASDFEKIT